MWSKCTVINKKKVNKLFELNTLQPVDLFKSEFKKITLNVVKAGTSVNQSAFIHKLIWMILTVSVADSYFVLYEKLFLQFLQSLQPSESSRTGMLINL